MVKKIERLPNFGDAGVLTINKLNSIPGFPKENEFNKGLIAVIECDEDIPCNPCENICPKAAIKIGIPITNLPVLDAELCSGCLKCIAICPGLCIFAVKKDYDNKNSLIYLPYEYSPLPKKDENIRALNRRGDFVCNGKVHKIIRASKKQNSSIVGIIVPKKHYNEVRHFETLKTQSIE